MSRSYRKQPFWSICGWCSTDKVVAGRIVRTAHKRAIRKEFLKGDFENFLLPHQLECRFNDVWSWSSDGKKYYKGARRSSQWDWKNHLKWRDVTEEELKIMEVQDYLDGNFTTIYPHMWKEPWGEKSGKTQSREDWEEYHIWPPLWYRKMLRK